MAENNDDFEIGDVESYGNPKDNGFSHQQLIMKTMSKALENAAKEMMMGWFETKQDKNGNVTRTYHEDTRLSFIQSVEAVLMAIECDLDDISRKEINELMETLEKKKTELLDSEEKEWSYLNPMIKMKLNENGKGFIKGYFNRDKRFSQLFIEEKVRIYGEIMKSISKLTQRLEFYQQQLFIA